MKKIFFALIILFINLSVANAAQIDSAKYNNDDDLIYPVVYAKNAEVSEKINAEIRREVQNFLVFADNTAADGYEPVKIEKVAVSYEITCNHENGILSIVLTEYLNFENSAHPSTFRRALNFNSDSGERIFSKDLSEIAHEEYGESSYSPKNLTRKLKAYAKENDIWLYGDFKELTQVPDDFYFDDNLHVHFIFQQYEVAPYAFGIIEFDASPKKSQ